MWRMAIKADEWRASDVQLLVINFTYGVECAPCVGDGQLAGQCYRKTLRYRRLSVRLMEYRKVDNLSGRNRNFYDEKPS